MNGSFLFKIIGVSLVYMYICGTTCWVGMVSCYSSTFVVSKMCRKGESAFFSLPSPPLPTSPLLKNVFVIILLVVRVTVPTTTAVVVAVS